ncbi:hypothetical protein AB0B12_40650 [Streptomyces sp. NPDC044780]|uniref:hypothetical protein n=1 Tax=unclassified Streptomyces TaxID=2593676 RepID=UPI003401DBA8
MVAHKGVPDHGGMGALALAQQPVDLGADVFEGLLRARPAAPPLRVLVRVVNNHDVDVVDGLELRAAAQGARSERFENVGLLQQRLLEQVPALSGQPRFLDVLINGLLQRVECLVDPHVVRLPRARRSARCAVAAAAAAPLRGAAENGRSMAARSYGTARH